LLDKTCSRILIPLSATKNVTHAVLKNLGLNPFFGKMNKLDMKLEYSKPAVI